MSGLEVQQHAIEGKDRPLPLQQSQGVDVCTLILSADETFVSIEAHEVRTSMLLMCRHRALTTEENWFIRPAPQHLLPKMIGWPIGRPYRRLTTFVQHVKPAELFANKSSIAQN